MRDIINSYLALIEATNHDGKTKSVKRKLINDYASFLESHNKMLSETTIQHLNAFLLTLEHLAPRTFNHRVSVLRSFYRWLYERDYIVIDWSELLTTKRVPEVLPRNVPLKIMIQICTPSTDELPLKKLYAKRNQAMVEFLFSTGVRCSELTDTCIHHLSSDLTECFVNSRKNGVPRYVFLGRPARDAIADYLSMRGIDVSDRPSLRKRTLAQPLFCKKNGKVMHPLEVNKVIQRLSRRRAHTTITPHMIRHTFATEFLRASGNIRALQMLLGHRSIDSTMVYCHLDTHDKFEAIEKHHPLSSEKFDK